MSSHGDARLPGTKAQDETRGDDGSLTYVDGANPFGLRSEPPPAFDDGKLFAGRYRVVREIAAGGFGRVLEVLDERSGAALALKLHRAAQRSSWIADALRGEFALLASMRHPNLAAVYDFGYAGGVAYFTQALVPGVRLDELDGLTLDSAQAAHLVAQLCHALDYLHARGTLHRDIKPANILVDPDSDHLVLLDFGISRALGTTGGRSIVGTYGYIAPEAIRGQPLDARSDLYSLGVMLYRLAAGTLPFATRGRDRVDVLQDHLHTPPPALPQQVPSSIAALIMQLLHKRPAERLASATEVLAAYSHATGHHFEPSTVDTLTSFVLSAPYVDPSGRLDALEEACTVGRASVVIEGEAGTGKSRTLRELRQRLQLRGVAWIDISSRSLEPGRAVPLELARAVLDDEVVASLHDDDRVELARAMPSLKRRGERLVAPVNSERARVARLDALGRAIALKLGARVGVITVDDLHETEPEILEALLRIRGAAHEAGAHCTFLLSGRASATMQAAAALPQASCFSTSELDPSGSRALVASTFGDTQLLDGSALGDALQRAPRSALWVQESLRLAVDRGHIVRRAGRFVLAGEVEALSPDALLKARLDLLADPALVLALANAVWDDSASVAELSRVAGRPLRWCAHALRELVRAGVVEEDMDARGRATYTMHDRYREVVLASARVATLRRMHERAAKALDKKSASDATLRVAAEHYLAARLSAQAAAALVAAAERAEAVGRPDHALAAITRALELTEGDDEDQALRLRAVDLARTCGQRAIALEHLKWLVRRAGRVSERTRAEIYLRLARHRVATGAGTMALRLARLALRTAIATRDFEGQIAARQLTGEIESEYGSLEAAATELRSAAALAASTDDRAAEARASLGLALASVLLGRTGEAHDAALHAANVLGRRGDPALLSDAHRQLGNSLREQGNTRGALRHYQRAVDSARACGSLEHEAKALNNLGTAAQFLGDVAHAMEAFERSIALKERAGLLAAALATRSNVAALHIAIGRFALAQQILEELVANEETRSTIAGPIALANLGDALAAQGELGGAIARYSESIEVCRARSFSAQRSHALCGLSRALVMRRGAGDLERAGQACDELGAIASELEVAEASRRHLVASAALSDAHGEHRAAAELAGRARREHDRVTRFSDLFATPLEAAWLEALTLAHGGRAQAATRALATTRRSLDKLASLVRDPETRRSFLEAHPIHRAIAAGDLTLEPGWTWAPALAGAF